MNENDNQIKQKQELNSKRCTLEQLNFSLDYLLDVEARIRGEVQDPLTDPRERKLVLSETQLVSCDSKLQKFAATTQAYILVLEQETQMIYQKRSDTVKTWRIIAIIILMYLAQLPFFYQGTGIQASIVTVAIIAVFFLFRFNYTISLPTLAESRRTLERDIRALDVQLDLVHAYIHLPDYQLKMQKIDGEDGKNSQNNEGTDYFRSREYLEARILETMLRLEIYYGVVEISPMDLKLRAPPEWDFYLSPPFNHLIAEDDLNRIWDSVKLRYKKSATYSV